MKQYVSFFLIFAFSFLTNSAEIIGRIIKVYDGDTIKIEEEKGEVINGKIKKGKFKIRFSDIDAPELHQQYGENAKTHLQILCDSKKCLVVYHEIDNYGRIVGTVYLIDNIVGFDITKSESLNDRMIKDGFAWWYEKYSKRTYLLEFQEDAILNKRGMWKENNNTPPWKFRKLNKKNK